MIAVHKSLPSTPIPSPSDLEVVVVKLGLDNDFAICCVYVPPDSLFLYISSLINFLTDIVSSFNKCVMVGDFNFRDVDWLSFVGSSSLSNLFCEFIFDNPACYRAHTCKR